MSIRAIFEKGEKLDLRSRYDVGQELLEDIAGRSVRGFTAAECYALGLDPTDSTNDFRIVSIELVDGKPKVEREPKVNRLTGAEIQAVLKGAERLDGPWADVPDEGGSRGRSPSRNGRDGCCSSRSRLDKDMREW